MRRVDQYNTLLSLIIISTIIHHQAYPHKQAQAHTANTCTVFIMYCCLVVMSQLVVMDGNYAVTTVYELNTISLSSGVATNGAQVL